MLGARTQFRNDLAESLAAQPRFDLTKAVTADDIDSLIFITLES